MRARSPRSKADAPLRSLLSGGDLARDDLALMRVVLRGLESFEHSGSKALQTRARHIRRRIGDTANARVAGLLSKSRAEKLG